MKKLILFLSISCCIFLFVGCAKITDAPLTEENKMVSHAAVFSDNIQTRYNVLYGSWSLGAAFVPEARVYRVEMYSYPLIYAGRSTNNDVFRLGMGANAAQKDLFNSIVGKPMSLTINGAAIHNALLIPYTNRVTIAGRLNNWEISKSAGLKFSWTLQKGFDSTVIANPPLQQASSVTTYITLSPDSPSTSKGKYFTWKVAQGVTEFTIPATALSDYALGEEVGIDIRTINTSDATFNGLPITLEGYNSTSLRSIKVVP